MLIEEQINQVRNVGSRDSEEQALKQLMDWYNYAPAQCLTLDWRALSEFVGMHSAPRVWVTFLRLSHEVKHAKD
jgi:hypothetical protein